MLMIKRSFPWWLKRKRRRKDGPYCAADYHHVYIRKTIKITIKIKYFAIKNRFLASLKFSCYWTFMFVCISFIIFKLPYYNVRRNIWLNSYSERLSLCNSINSNHNNSPISQSNQDLTSNSSFLYIDHVHIRQTSLTRKEHISLLCLIEKQY